MLFNSWLFAFFFALTFAVYWALRSARQRQWFLIAASAVFYAAYYPPHLPFILAMTVAVFALADAAAHRSARRRAALLASGAAACVAVLAYYKYQGLGRDSLEMLGVGPPSWLGDVRAPLAISFFTFEYVHYLIGIRRGTFRRGSFADFGLFVLFFPTLICGPIKRFGDFAPQIPQARLDADDLSTGLARIVVGIAKKTLVADAAARWIAPVWADPSSYGTAALWLATYGYAVQIYFDFAGYSDIAIGAARLLGYRIPENFDAPYLKSNIAAFWRSWHISLTTWLRDYVYVPLGGNREGRGRAHVNRLITMTLCGLWHGAAWHFAAWGLYHGLGLTAHNVYRNVRQRRDPEWQPSTHPAARALAVAATFHFVCIGWVLFVLDFATASRTIAHLLWLA